MGRTFGTQEFLYLLKAIPWTLLLSLGALAGGAFVGLFIAILRTPPTVGSAVQLIKSTSIAAIIGFVELPRAGQLMTTTTFKPMIVYPIVAALYFILCWPLSLLARTLERRIDATLGIKKHF